MKITDDIGRVIVLENPPKRIISLVPSLTLTLADFDLEKYIVAVTRFCKYPEDLVVALPKVGGPKKIDIERIRELKPDIVFAVKEENNKEQILNLAKDIPVVVFDISIPEDAFRMMNTLGIIFQKKDKAEELITKTEHALTKFPVNGKGDKCIYLIWKNPWMAAGNETYIGSMLKIAGFKNVITGRYPQVDAKSLQKAETVLLATEPYPFKENDRKELQKMFPDKTVKIVSGELFTWFGTYVLKYVES